MEKEIESFLNAEETAIKLVETLRQLQTETNYYINAKEELNVVGKRILELAKSMEDLGITNKEIIQKILQIGGPEIFKQLKEIYDKIDTIFNKTIEEINLFKENSNSKFEELNRNILDNSLNQQKMLTKITKLIIITLGSSILAIIIGIIGLII